VEPIDPGRIIRGVREAAGATAQIVCMALVTSNALGNEEHLLSSQIQFVSQIAVLLQIQSERCYLLCLDGGGGGGGGYCDDPLPSHPGIFLNTNETGGKCSSTASEGPTKSTCPCTCCACSCSNSFPHGGGPPLLRPPTSLPFFLQQFS